MPETHYIFDWEQLATIHNDVTAEGTYSIFECGYVMLLHLI